MVALQRLESSFDCLFCDIRSGKWEQPQPHPCLPRAILQIKTLWPILCDGYHGCQLRNSDQCSHCGCPARDWGCIDWVDVSDSIFRLFLFGSFDLLLYSTSHNSWLATTGEVLAAFGGAYFWSKYSLDLCLIKWIAPFPNKEGFRENKLRQG